MPRAAPSPQLIRRASASAYVTQCKVCGAGIYDHDKRVWSRKPLGLCHTSCVDVERAEHVTAKRAEWLRS